MKTLILILISTNLFAGLFSEDRYYEAIIDKNYFKGKKYCRYIYNFRYKNIGFQCNDLSKRLTINKANIDHSLESNYDEDSKDIDRMASAVDLPLIAEEALEAYGFVHIRGCATTDVASICYFKRK